MKKIVISVVTIILSGVLLSGCTTSTQEDISLTATNQSQQNSPSASQQPLPATNQESASMKTLSDFTPIDASQATLHTTKGDITFVLYREEAPITTLNFLTLADEGFYDEIVFHRVINDFMAQVGDPLTKDSSLQNRWGTGGPGYTIPDEFSPELRHDQPGVVSMANSGPNTGGSQFFITYEATPWLDDVHSVFGQVTSGMDVLEQIEVGDKIISVSYQ